MTSSLSSGLSGLRANQKFLDVAGNNIANLNTEGFKASRITFGDVFGALIEPGSGPTATSGGVNPQQVGAGVSVASIDRDMSQGVLRATGRVLDLAIDGRGFFVTQDAGGAQRFSRAGTFGTDAAGNLVDSRTGALVLDDSAATIKLPLGDVLPGSASTSVTLRGNLPGEVTGPFAEILATAAPWLEGTSAAVAGSNSQPFVLTNGDTMTLSVDGGVSQTVTFSTADFASIGAATAAEVATALNAQISGILASAASGSLTITSLRTGTESTIDVDDGTGSPATTLGLSTALTRGTSVAASDTTLLNDLADNLVDYVSGDRIQVTGTEVDGTAVSATFTFGASGDGTTLAQLRDFVSAQFTSATASIDATGRLQLTADAAGSAALSLFLTDDVSNTGSTRFANHFFEVAQDGADPDTVRASIEIFDPQGRPQTLTIDFSRSAVGTWDAIATLPDGVGTVIDGSVAGILFGSDGSFQGVSGTGTGDIDIEFRWDDLGGELQTVTLDLGSAGTFDGLTQFGGSASAAAVSQDGFGVGELDSIGVRRDGVIEGFYTNGQVKSLATVGIATFANEEGLQSEGAATFSATSASGVATIGQGGSGAAGLIVSGSLEESNVELNEEFIRLIQAQRAYQANARVVSVSDRVLAELVNTI